MHRCENHKGRVTAARRPIVGEEVKKGYYKRSFTLQIDEAAILRGERDLASKVIIFVQFESQSIIVLNVCIAG